MNKKKQICKWGHDTFLPGGRDKWERCTICLKERGKAYEEKNKLNRF